MVDTNLAARLEELRATGEFGTSVVEHLGKYLVEQPDEVLYRMSPLRYAQTEGLRELDAIDLFLHATRAGVLEFTWGVLCPACAAFLVAPGGIRSLVRKRHCALCQMPVTGRLDENVEVAFTVAPSIRRIRFHDPESLDPRADGLALYFSTSLAKDDGMRPVIGPAILWHGRVSPGESTQGRVSLPPGRYVLLSPHTHTALRLVAREGGPTQVPVDVLDHSIIPERAAVAAGEVDLQIRSRVSRTVGLLLFPDPLPLPEERSSDTMPPAQRLLPYLSGKRLLTSQAFRDLFRTESVPAEGGLELRSLTVLFTDLKGSTEMYERLGDLRAFSLVRGHFQSLHRVVARAGGAVVKNIGDAIMASFCEPEAAMQAALAMNHSIQGLPGGSGMSLKIGLHAGPCIAVDLNDRLDYFGKTVNVAARVQGLADANEIVCTESLFGSAGVAAACAAASCHARHEHAMLKGIGDFVPIVRLTAPDR
jgi:class 3 adenylate cyclase